MACARREEETEGKRTAGKAGKTGHHQGKTVRRDDRSKQVAGVTLFGFSIFSCGKLIAFRTTDD